MHTLCGNNVEVMSSIHYISPLLVEAPPPLKKESFYFFIISSCKMTKLSVHSTNSQDSHICSVSFLQLLFLSAKTIYRKILENDFYIYYKFYYSQPKVFMLLLFKVILLLHGKKILIFKYKYQDILKQKIFYISHIGIFKNGLSFFFQSNNFLMFFFSISKLNINLY